MIIFTEMNKYKIYYSDNKKIMNLINKYKNIIIKNYNFCYGYNNLKNYYINYVYQNNKLICIKYYNYPYYLHRKDGPALIRYYNNGEIWYKLYYLNGENYSHERYILELNNLV